MDESMIPSTLAADHSFVSDPYFVLVAVGVLIAVGLLLKLVFNSSTTEYRHDPSFE